MTYVPLRWSREATAALGGKSLTSSQQRLHRDTGLTEPGLGEQAAVGIDPSGGQVLARQLDVTAPRSVAVTAEWAADHLGRLDVLINNAAVEYDTDQRSITADLDRVSRALDTNLLGAWPVSKAFLPLLRRSSHPRIVSVSSEAGAISEMTGGPPAYSVSQAALNALTRLMAADLRADRILVNTVCPGWTDTDMRRGGRPVPESL